MADDVRNLLQRLHRRRPRLHAVAGAVVVPFIADVAGALGAAPALTHEPDEARHLATTADAVLVNLSQPDPLRREGAQAAARAADAAGVPWVLDPVLAHASPRRKAHALALLQYYPAILKPNANELRVLAGDDTGNGSGAASSNTPGSTLGNDNLPAQLAIASGAVVLISGETDIISDGTRTTTITGGHVFMDTLPGFGCALGIACAALLAVADDAFTAARAAARAFAEAGSRAAEGMRGPGSFRIAFLDELHRLGEAS